VNKANVLKITTATDGNSVALKLEGRVEGPWVEVLRKSWADAAARDGRARIVVDLDGVASADARGRLLLLEMQKRGVGLVKPSGFMRQMLEQGRLELGGNSDFKE